MIRQSKAQTNRVNITKYVKVAGEEDSGWRFCPVVWSSNGRIRADYVVLDGKTEFHKEGAYYIEWYEAGKRRRESIGKSANDAFAAAERKAQILKNAALGIEVVGDNQHKEIMLSGACQNFIEETRLLKRPKTYSQYKTALEYFRESCPDKPLSCMQRTDLTRFMGFLAEKKELQSRTIWNKVLVVISMLKANGITRILPQRDWPRYTEARPEIFTTTQVEKFLAECDPWKRTLFEFFWMTGFREQEVQYATWSDVDFENRVVCVNAKPKMGFIPKDWEEREVPMPDRLYNTLRAHQARCPRNCHLVFATSNGRVVHNFLRQCKSIAWQAGLNCGLCHNGQGQCSKRPCCENWFLHKFRATFATMHLRAGVDLRTVQEWMGHKDLESTSRYLQPARGKEALRMVNSTFALNSTASSNLPS